MEDLIKKRSPVGANFTKHYNALITALNEKELNPEDNEKTLSSLERTAIDLSKFDESICSALIDAKSENYDNECEKIEEKTLEILCPETSNNTKINITQNATIEENIVLANQSQPEVLLQTPLVLIVAGGKSKTVRALFDTGSQRSYILISTINEIQAAAEPNENLTHVVFGRISSKKNHNCYKFSVSNLKKTYYCNMQVLDLQVISGYIPSIQEGPCIAELQNKGIQLNGVGKGFQPIELLIGADYAENFFTGNVYNLVWLL
ncbi:hypothetical protein AVEN_163744-1 [Araneus ventricosus]|uniref:Uncharacterized protein n=1 Tax=Araneus ventricosus TaxID=182803 RepID=A0A4Y2MZU0_ARAVE|nr:hypothetical protein AVEN_163744-1 [Araneus ventricosus]